VEVEQEDFGDVDGFEGTRDLSRESSVNGTVLDNARIQPPLPDDPVPA
jgi:hypothetical protein